MLFVVQHERNPRVQLTFRMIPPSEVGDVMVRAPFFLFKSRQELLPLLSAVSIFDNGPKYNGSRVIMITPSWVLRLTFVSSRRHLSLSAKKITKKQKRIKKRIRFLTVFNFLHLLVMMMKRLITSHFLCPFCRRANFELKNGLFLLETAKLLKTKGFLALQLCYFCFILFYLNDLEKSENEKKSRDKELGPLID